MSATLPLLGAMFPRAKLHAERPAEEGQHRAGQDGRHVKARDGAAGFSLLGKVAHMMKLHRATHAHARERLGLARAQEALWAAPVPISRL